LFRLYEDSARKIPRSSCVFFGKLLSLKALIPCGGEILGEVSVEFLEISSACEVLVIFAECVARFWELLSRKSLNFLLVKNFN